MKKTTKFRCFSGLAFKFDLKMKLTTLLLLVALFKTNANTYSQNTRITLDMTQVSVQEVIDEIESLSEFKFFIDNKKVDVTRIVTIKEERKRISRILKELFSGTDISYEVFNKQIILKNEKEEKENVPVETMPVSVQEAISGTITDAGGVPLPGVNVVVVGTNKGAQTDFEGNFTIDANDGDVLQFTYVGFKTVKITVGAQANYNIALQEDTSELDEVVIVGYGTIEKRKLTSSVTSINVEDNLQEIPSTNLSTALTGRFSGVNIIQNNGKPGTTSNINIRGATQGGFSGSTEPLYVIDNVVSSKLQFDLLDVNEVENVSLLKDASAAAVYGARAANGVVLVTTRRGKTGKPSINITSSIGTTEVAFEPEFTTAYEYSKLLNSYFEYENVAAGDPRYITDTELEYLRQNNYGNFAEQFSVSPVLARNAVNVSGATDNINYFLSASNIRETGMFENMSYEKTNLRAKVGVDITDNLNVSLNLATTNDSREEFYWRWNGSDEDFGDFYRTATRNGMWGPARKDGLFVANFNGWNAGNIIDNGQGWNDRRNRNTNIVATLTYKIPFVEGLEVGATYNRNNNRYEQDLVRLPLTDYTFGTDPNNRFLLTDEIVGERVRFDDGSNTNSISQNTNEEDTYQLNFRLDYKNTFGKHDVSAFAIYEESEYSYDNISALRRGLISPLVPQLFATDPAADQQFVSGGASETGRQSVIGSFNYSYDDKYLLQGTFRADASVRFAPENRWGYFPALSAGWVLSKEDFFKLDFVDFAKIRTSFGKTGNDDVLSQLFPYLQRYTIGTAGVLGTSDGSAQGTFIGGTPDPSVTWATQTSFNFGLDLAFLGHKLTTSLEIYKNKRRDLYGSRQGFIPLSTGITLLPENYGAVDVKGFEIETNYRNNIDDFNYDFGVKFAYNDNKYAAIDEPESRRPFELLSGRSVERIWGLKALGIIRTQEQLDQLIADGYTINGGDPQLGELYFKDVRGNSTDDFDGVTPDGIIDGNDNEIIADRTTPPINYGFTLNLSYKGFSLQAFAQGLAGHYKATPANGRFTFTSIGQASWDNWIDSWTPENTNASFPRFNSRFIQSQSTFWVRRADFIRMKYINFSYEIPEGIVSKIGAKRISLFSNVTNPFFIYRKDIKDFDPEISGRGCAA